MNKNAKDLIGQKFGKLTVVKLIGLNKRSARIWECLCDCGNTISGLDTNTLKRHSKSCGCIRAANALKKRTGTKNIPGYYICSVKKGAESRNFEYSVTNEYLQKTLEDQNFKCILSGRDLLMEVSNTHHLTGEWGKNTGSIDRIDSTKGYVEGNIQWIHKDLQSPKSSKTNQEFYNMCKLIVDNYKGNKND